MFLLTKYGLNLLGRCVNIAMKIVKEQVFLPFIIYSMQLEVKLIC